MRDSYAYLFFKHKQLRFGCNFCPDVPEQWHPILLDTLAWAPRESSSLLWSHSGMGRAAPRIWRRWLLISGHPSGSRWLMPGSSTSPATLSHTMIRCSTPPPCLAPFHPDMVGLVERLGLIPTSPWLEVMPLCLLWRWPSGLTPTSKWLIAHILCCLILMMP